MHLLSIETSTPRSSVALADQDGTIVSTSLGIGQRHGEFLAPAIRFCLDQAGLEARDVTGVAVGTGPGLYTGLRVGIATAKTFAAALQLPVVGLSGLDVLAFQMRHARRLICAALDARRKELFWAFYRCVPGGVQRQTELRVGSPDRLTGEIQAAGEECLVVGDGGFTYADRFREVDAELAGSEHAFPDAADLATLAVPRFVREETERPDELTPLYLRQADAKIGWATRGRLRGGAAAP
ncbi:MAG TPA: tRNA (adenosine(37)-N6)-threonylcarbamoyltransferase complex dimerization subunit type 1 TsaB [Nitriliruptorales bacterium]